MKWNLGPLPSYRPSFKIERYQNCDIAILDRDLYNFEEERVNLEIHLYVKGRIHNGEEYVWSEYEASNNCNAKVALSIDDDTLQNYHCREIHIKFNQLDADPDILKFTSFSSVFEISGFYTDKDGKQHDCMINNGKMTYRDRIGGEEIDANYELSAFLNNN